jgi:hypothetical protein
MLESRGNRDSTVSRIDMDQGIVRIQHKIKEHLLDLDICAKRRWQARLQHRADFDTGSLHARTNGAQDSVDGLPDDKRLPHERLTPLEQSASPIDDIGRPNGLSYDVA